MSMWERLGRSRQELLDLTLRNPLISFRALKAKGVAVVDELPWEVFRMLVAEEKAMYFEAAPKPDSATVESPDSEAVATVESGTQPGGDPPQPGDDPSQAGDDPPQPGGDPPHSGGDDPPPELLAMIAESEPDDNAPADRHVDNRLQTAHDSVRLEVRLRNTMRHAASSIEEQGVNILYLALGMLEWYESEASETPRSAPLVLVPVALSRETAGARFKLRWTGEEVGPNLSLATKLRGDFDVVLPHFDDGEDLDVVEYFREVGEAVAHKDRWTVNRQAVQLGFFSFSKLLIYQDLDPDAWRDEEGPEEHPVVDALYGDSGFAEDPPSIPEGDNLDDHLAVAEIHNVLDSDSSQNLAIVDAQDGRNLVVQGPPGTGKSQMITNLVAEAVARGRTVLFVAEKLAALKVVKRRLDTVHVGDACLELHSHTANKRTLLDELRRTMALGEPRLEDPAGDRALLEDRRKRLNEYSRSVNEPVGKSGLSPNELIGKLALAEGGSEIVGGSETGDASQAGGGSKTTGGTETVGGTGTVGGSETTGGSEVASGTQAIGGSQAPSGTRWPRLQVADAASWTREQFVVAGETVREAQDLVATVGAPREHVYWGSRRRQYLPTDERPVSESLAATAAALRRHRADVAALRQLVGADVEAETAAQVDALLRAVRRVVQAPDLSGADHRSPAWTARPDRILEVVDQLREIAGLRSRYDPVLIPEAWDANVLSCRQALAAGGGTWWRRLGPSYRRAHRELLGLCRNEVPRSPQEQLAVVDGILRVKRLRSSIDGARDLVAELFPNHPSDRPATSDLRRWDGLCEAAGWLVALHRDIGTGEVSPVALDLLDASASRDPKPASRDLKPAGRASKPPGRASVEPADRGSLETAEGACQQSAKALATSLDALSELLEWDESRCPLNADPLAGAFPELERWLGDAAQRPGALQEVARFNQVAARLAQSGLESLAEAAASWPGAGLHLVDLYERRFYRAWLEQAFQERPLLAEFDGTTHEGVVDRFRRLDVDRLLHNRALVAKLHWERVPRSHGGGQLAVLRREFEKKRRHLPLRKLMTTAGNAIQGIKPVFMMSPLSIAKFIPPGSLRFDMVIFDEASQVRPVDAMGAIMRGRQTVVVGDSKQLPPTTFFDRAVDEDADGEGSHTADLESILGMFCAQGAPERMLRWHYRSRHESLIAVSNHEFYDSRLVVFPSPDRGREDTGVAFRCDPEAHYKRGKGGRVNPAEAQAVAQAVVEHAATQPKLTLGVAAFSLAQARRIEDEVEILRRKDPSTEAFFRSHPQEPFFVKNLENVQGDERDVILISVGYGKTEGGHLPMNFGPLNREGGERRLNVLITRARRRCVVHCNFVAADLDLRRSGARGVEALKTYLKYAETGLLDMPRATGRDADSPFEEAVAAALRSKGHDVEHQVGSAGFRIDLAVVDPRRPGRYLLGIECDGAAYHSARSARDRDRLRQQVLEGLGWTIHRIWSTDWFRYPDREVAKTEDAIRRAAVLADSASDRGPGSTRGPGDGGAVRSPHGATQDDGAETDADAGPGGGAAGSGAPMVLERAPAPEPEDPVAEAEPYRLAEPSVELGGREFHDVPVWQVLEWLESVVEVESPVHEEEAAARVAAAAGIRRMGRRIRDRASEAARRGVLQGRLVRRGRFLWRPGHEEATVRSRAGLPTSHKLRSPEMIPPEEVEAALLQVIDASYGIFHDDAVAGACRLMGFRRKGARLADAFAGTLGSLVEAGEVEDRRGFLHRAADRRSAEDTAESERKT